MMKGILDKSIQVCTKQKPVYVRNTKLSHTRILVNNCGVLHLVLINSDFKRRFKLRSIFRDACFCYRFGAPCNLFKVTYDILNWNFTI